MEAWRLSADSRMPTFAEIARPLPDFRGQGGIGGLPEPHGGGGFITDPDVGSNIECSVWDQDCPRGEKCAAWADDGGSAWNSTRCVPIDPSPVGVGETCVVEGSGVSGIDNCDAGAMCWAVDTETSEGTCVALCTGSENAPSCGPAATTCSIANEGVLTLCLPVCNPLADECDEGEGCYPIDDTFQCAPSAGEGGVGEPCEFVNACASGHACVNSGIVPGCPAGSAGCCTSYCDLEGDGSECVAGQECMPWYEMGEAPDACLEGAGICSTTK